MFDFGQCCTLFRPAEELTISIPEARFDLHSEVIGRRQNREVTGEIVYRLYDIDSQIYRYEILGGGDSELFCEHQIELKTPCASTEIVP